MNIQSSIHPHVISYSQYLCKADCSAAFWSAVHSFTSWHALIMQCEWEALSTLLIFGELSSCLYNYPYNLHSDPFVLDLLAFTIFTHWLFNRVAWQVWTGCLLYASLSFRPMNHWLTIWSHTKTQCFNLIGCIDSISGSQGTQISDQFTETAAVEKYTVFCLKDHIHETGAFIAI